MSGDSLFSDWQTYSIEYSIDIESGVKDQSGVKNFVPEVTSLVK
jgi:hypothetical protein